MTENKKIVIGWFSFSCCEDSSVMLTELLNEHYKEWLKIIDFKYVKILRKKRPIGPMDVGFIEGAIASKEQEDEVKKIRENAKKVVAIGSCACTGMPSGNRNAFDEATKQEIKALIEKFNYGEKVKKLEEVVEVDYKVPGCPMNNKKFLETLDIIVKEFSK